MPPPSAFPPPDVRVVGYVEPVPRLYSRLATLCDMMIEGFSIRNISSDRIINRLIFLRDYLLLIKTISEKELRGESLTNEEIKLIELSGKKLESIVSIDDFEDLTSATDERMAIVADVHTYPGPVEPVVLEEAVGNPMIIYVAVEIEGRIVLTRGGMFSYYEFTQPLNERLTDEAWQAMMDQGNAPSMPVWVGVFVSDAETD